MGARSGADEEVLYKPFTARAVRISIAEPCRVSDRSNLLDSKIVLLENGPGANSTCYKKTKGGREGKGSRVLYSFRQI